MQELFSITAIFKQYLSKGDLFWLCKRILPSKASLIFKFSILILLCITTILEVFSYFCRLLYPPANVFGSQVHRVKLIIILSLQPIVVIGLCILYSHVISFLSPSSTIISLLLPQPYSTLFVSVHIKCVLFCVHVLYFM